MAKRKRSTVADVDNGASMALPLPPPVALLPTTTLAKKASKAKRAIIPLDVSLPVNDTVEASVAVENEAKSVPYNAPARAQRKKTKMTPATKAEASTTDPQPKKEPVAIMETGVAALTDAEAEGEEDVKQALSRPPPVNSDYLPLPWKGRLGYACLNTYLRNSNPPVFSSRTCRIASILEHRHPLKDPLQPEHPIKNRPDKEQPADVRRGQKWVENLGLQNARDIPKMIRWNDKYGIKFMRLSSEMFPFATHAEYGYKLAPFASEVLAEAGKVIAELGHRVTTHPGQYTQLGSPRKEVIESAIRDLDYHDEMLSLLKLPEQQNRDAVMILHMGGVFGSKEETLQRFRTNYARLRESVKRRLVLENDDMGWSVHDLLPICQELNIPMVLDFHHHNIVFDKDKVREGTKDLMELLPAIRETWTRKGITQKMHYSEQTPPAITPMQRRKHSPRVMTLPPCAPNMDLMIEAKDKEQAVFELMRTFKLPGFNLFNEIIPHVRHDENKPVKAKKKATPKKAKKSEAVLEEAAEELEEDRHVVVPEDEVGMGGPDGRVYWPPGMEEWLRPKKQEAKKKDPTEVGPKKTLKKGKQSAAVEDEVKIESKNKPKRTPAKKPKRELVPTPSTSDVDEMDFDDEGVVAVSKTRSARSSRRVSKVNYMEVEEN